MDNKHVKRAGRSLRAKRPRGLSHSPKNVNRVAAGQQKTARPVNGERTQIAIHGRDLALSNLEKVFYPAVGFTKGQVIDYYTRVAGALLPHLKDRPLTLKRYPNGVEAEFFYEKRCPRFRPPWVKTAEIWSRPKSEHISYCVLNDLPSLTWAVNLADLEMHTSLAREQKPECPTLMVFDLDPGEGAGTKECAAVALWLRDWLAERALQCFPKTSGSKGLQVYVPSNTSVNFDQTKSFARHAAEQLTAAHPNEVLARMEKRLRPGKVFIDWSQNDDHKTTVSVYSLRAKARPTVSTPLKWEEVERARKSSAELSFEAPDVLKRVEKWGDLFEPVLQLKQKLPPLPR